MFVQRGFVDTASLVNEKNGFGHRMAKLFRRLHNSKRGDADLERFVAEHGPFVRYLP